jgi:carboxymethylenebutenolidase
MSPGGGAGRVFGHGAGCALALGRHPRDPDKARDLIGNLDDKSTRQNYVAAVKFLKTHPLSTGKVGVIGFCWGGRMANLVAGTLLS